MPYYTLKLEKESANLCIINTPFGLFCYNRLPIGITTAPDFVQEVKDFTDVLDVYLDDIGVFSATWDARFLSLKKVLPLLEITGFMVHPLKCEWGMQVSGSHPLA